MFDFSFRALPKLSKSLSTALLILFLTFTATPALADGGALAPNAFLTNVWSWIIDWVPFFSADDPKDQPVQAETQRSGTSIDPNGNPAPPPGGGDGDNANDNSSKDSGGPMNPGDIFG